MEFHSGFIAIVGRPNAGKSTLINGLLRQKIAITTPKAQTTRNNIMGILTHEDAQYIFIDTPGVHKPKHELGKTLNKNAYSAIAEADVNFYVVDASQPFGSGDEFMLEKIKQSHIPSFLIVNKIDLLEKEQLMNVLTDWSKRANFAEIFPISALKQDNVDALLQCVKKYLPIGVKYFPDDMVCDHGENFRISEIIREKVIYKTNEEVPHSVAVIIENKEQIQDELLIQAMIVVERTSQKSILIGKQGSMIKAIRQQAQRELRKALNQKVVLELYVRVEKNWRNRLSKLNQFGYLEKEDYE